jgi:sugar/nucleoside kinase (ribokinase family)
VAAIDRPLGVFVGLATLDVIHHVTARPGPDQKVTAQRQFVAAGGPATNAAVTFAALGGRARLVTALGSGPIGRLIGSELAGYGVEVLDVGAPEYEPAVSAIAVESGGLRSVISPDARGSQVSTSAEVVSGADAVLVDGHHRDLAMAAAAGAACAGIDLVVDAGRWKPVLSELISYASAMICSADFRLPEHSGDDQDRTALALAARGVPVVVTTHGPDPLRWWHGGTAGTLDVPPVQAVDTLGAGDVFHGAYLFAGCRPPQPADAGPVDNNHADAELLARLRFATEVAALACTAPGTRSWIDAIPAFLARRGSGTA